MRVTLVWVSKASLEPLPQTPSVDRSQSREPSHRALLKPFRPSGVSQGWMERCWPWWQVGEMETKVKWKSLNHVRLFATPWTIQSIEFSRPEYWGGLPFPSPGYLPNPGIEPRSPSLQADSLPAEPQGKAMETKEREYMHLKASWMGLVPRDPCRVCPNVSTFFLMIAVHTESLQQARY